MLALAVPQRELDLYALSLNCGPIVEPHQVLMAWRSEDGISVGALLIHSEHNDYSALVMRRQVDHRFVQTYFEDDIVNESDAISRLMAAMKIGDAPEPIPPGVKKRKLLVTPNQKAGPSYKLLTGSIDHYPALMALGEVYLAMPKPDNNFVPDFQTGNFDARLWELYLLACFREQGIAVSQKDPSPDFYIQMGSHACYIEAVTANSSGTKSDQFEPRVPAPEDPEERLLGPAAIRFAKTLRSKLLLEYEKLPHVQGKSFALAIADFHASGSMMWTREALPSYLYGLHIQTESTVNGPRAVANRIGVLKGEQNIPAGLFHLQSAEHLSAVIFSNSATLAKFNRMGFLAGTQPPRLQMIRTGLLYDRSPGALQPIPFELDVLSEEYSEMWPGGEAWSQELEVFHNPLAKYPIPFDLLPGATHWFEEEGEVRCVSPWEWQVLSSMTIIRWL